MENLELWQARLKAREAEYYYVDWIEPTTPLPLHWQDESDLTAGIAALRSIRINHSAPVEIMPQVYEQYEYQMQPEHYSYWRRRGFPSALTMAFRVGWTGKRFAFPWFYRGILTAIKLRRNDELTPDLEPKYISVRGSHFYAPYNIDSVTALKPDRVIIVEDEKSVMAAARLGFVAIGAPANAWREAWSMLLIDVPEVVIVADRDEAGQNAAHKRRDLLGRGRIVTPNMYMPDGSFATDLHDWLQAACLPMARRRLIGDLSA